MFHTSRQLTPTPGPGAQRVLTRATTVAAALGVACTLLLSTPASADDATPSPTPTAPVVTEPVLSAITDGNGYRRVDLPLKVAVEVSNPTDEALITGTARVAIGTKPFATAAEAQQWHTNSTPAHTYTELGLSAFPAITAGSTASAELTVAPTTPALAAVVPGVYPLRVTYTSGTHTFTSESIITIAPATTPTARTGLVIPITTDAGSQALLSAETLETLTAPGGDLFTLTAALERTPRALLAIDPAIPASIRALGSKAPASASAWWTTLENLPNERFTLQFADADVTTQLAGGLAAPLEPISLDYALDATAFRGRDADDASPSPTPTPTATTAETISLPTLAELTDITESFPAWWPAEGAVTSEVLSAAGDHTVLTSSASTAGAVGYLTADGTDLLAYNADLASTLTKAATAKDDTERADLLSLATGLVQLQATATGASPAFVALERGSGWDAAALSETLSIFTGSGPVLPVMAADMLTTPGTATAFTPAAADQGRIDALKTALHQEEQISSFSTILETPELLLGRERAYVLRLLSAEWSTPEELAGAVETQAARITEILTSVEIVQPKQVTLVSSTSNIPMFVRNKLPFPVNVVIVARPDDIRLTVAERTEVAAAASSTTRTAIDITARISSGDVRISLDLVSADGKRIDQTRYADVSVRAEWERIGLIIMGSMLALLFGLGAFRMWRRRKRNAAAGIVEEKKPSKREVRAAYRASDAENDPDAQAPAEEERG